MTMKFGRLLRRLRVQRGLTQAQLAQRLACAALRVSEWERGVRKPRPLTQEAILACLRRTGARPRRHGRKGLFKNRLRVLRLRGKLTKVQVSRILNILPQRVYEWEKGLRVPKPLTQAAVLARLRRYASPPPPRRIAAARLSASRSRASRPPARRLGPRK